MHCASLGEFEQGRPLLEALRSEFPRHSLVLSFFSPSGYEIRKDYPGADLVCYLPADTKTESEEFIRIFKPEIGIFIKYDLWLNHIDQAARSGCQLYLVAASFRADQVFFKPWGLWHRQALSRFQRIFCQDKESMERIQSIFKQKETPLPQVPIIAFAPDPRFDRVLHIAQSHAELPEPVLHFTGSGPLMVAGSTWPRDEDLLAELLSKNLRPSGWKLIIAPHEVSQRNTELTRKKFGGKVAVLSELNINSKNSYSISHASSEAEVLIIDRMGLLASLYRLSGAAYIGGGFGAGIHNTLEAAVYGQAIAFGPRYQRFREARELIDCGAAVSVRNSEEFSRWFEGLQSSGQQASVAAKDYVSARAGGTRVVMEAIRRDVE